MSEFELNRLIGEAVGEASMCWNPRPTGIFNSEHAVKITERVVAALQHSQSPSTGHKWKVSASRMPPRPSCPDCGLESLSGNVHEQDCIRLKPAEASPQSIDEKLNALKPSDLPQTEKQEIKTGFRGGYVMDQPAHPKLTCPKEGCGSSNVVALNPKLFECQDCESRWTVEEDDAHARLIRLKQLKDERIAELENERDRYARIIAEGVDKRIDGLLEKRIAELTEALEKILFLLSPGQRCRTLQQHIQQVAKAALGQTEDR